MAAATNMTAYELSLRGRAGGLTAAALVGRKEMTKPATAGFLKRFERQIEEARPGLRRADPTAFERSVQDAKRAYMQGLSLKSAQARREAKEIVAKVCGWCCAEAGRHIPAEPTICRKHTLAMKRQDQRLIRERHGVTLAEVFVRRAIAADADRLTELAIASITTDMRPYAPDPSDLAA